MRVKALHKKNLAKRIIVDSIKDHLIRQVSSLKTPKEMFVSLTKLFEGKSINQNMTLRNQLKNVKIQNAETIQSYFTRVSQIKEQLEAVDEEGKCRNCDNPLEWPPRIMGFIHSRNVFQKEVITFNRLWEECTQEESQLILIKNKDQSIKKITQVMWNMKNSIIEEPLIHLEHLDKK